MADIPGCRPQAAWLHSGSCRRLLPTPAVPNLPHAVAPLQITGDLWTPVDGIYSLFLSSTADSRLDFNGQRTIDVNDCATAYLDGSCLGEERSVSFWLPGQRWHSIRCAWGTCRRAGEA